MIPTAPLIRSHDYKWTKAGFSRAYFDNIMALELQLSAKAGCSRAYFDNVMLLEPPHMDKSWLLEGML